MNDINEINKILLSENINYKTANVESISYGTQNIHGFKTEEFLFEKEGYTYCGIIQVRDGKREAFQKILV